MPRILASCIGAGTVLLMACAAPPALADDDMVDPRSGIARAGMAAAVGAPMPVGVTINGRPLPDPALIVLSGPRLMVRASDLANWGIALPSGLAPVTLGGEGYLPLDALPGLAARLDEGGTVLAIDAETTRFPRAHYGPAEIALPRSRVIPAAFLDYDLTAMNDDGAISANAVIEAGASGAWGVISTTALADTGQRGLVRLETSWVRDFPGRRLRLVVGDTMTRPAAWGQPLRFAGVRLGTDFSLNPTELTYPLPQFSGSALQPSTLQLVSHAGSESADIAPGAFTYDYRPRFSGAGEVTMTLRDIAGNARTVTRSFYASTSLLRPGLTDASIEAGFQRRDFAMRSFAYGEPFVAAGVRTGLTPAMTAGARIEAGGGTLAGGMEATLVAEPVAELDVSAAVSRSSLGMGSLVRAQLRRDTPDWSLGFSALRASGAFRQVGDDRPAGPAHREFALSGSIALGALGAINGGLAQIVDGADVTTIASASWSASLGLAFATLGLQALRHDGETGLGAFGSLTVPLGPRRHASLIGDGDRMAAQYERNAPPGSGAGYRVLAGYDRMARGPWAEAAATFVGAPGRFDIQLAQRGNSTGLRAEMRGAIVAAGGTIAATPQLGYAMALIDVMADTEVTVTMENQPVATLAGAGRKVIVTALQPYAANRIGIDGAELPLDQTANLTDKVVAPGWRQMAAIRFGSRPTRPARIQAVDANGAVIPPGLRATQGGNVTVSGQDGEIYLADLSDRSPIRLSGQGFACSAPIPETLPTDLLTRPLRLVCGVAEN
jgi:outer membrane usher protein